ncbi:MAG: hypothetical protein QHC67_03005 [Sphingobium sp.]|uniref:acyltransferase family protein n=1 Tax=Sphingobium sp. TaxID=1912891 RepID=UPI0029BA87FB|nr:acyltransferase family protein [Sphingobium sp.]MDX3908766.1 hypothetical protein [Sphingobium sp.]
MQGPAQRQTWSDVGKGCGIIAVAATHILLHDPAVDPGVVRSTLGLTSIPAFFALAGLMFKPRPPMQLAMRRVRSMLGPYVAFLCLVMSGVLARDFVLGGNSLPSLEQFLWGGAILKGDFGTFWFLTSLLFTQIAYNALAFRYPDPAGPVPVSIVAAILLVGTAILHIFPGLSLPWSLETLPFTIPLFWFGHLLQRERAHARWIGLAMIAVIGAAIVALLFGQVFRIGIKGGFVSPPVLGLLFGMVMARLAVLAYRGIAKIPLLAPALSNVGQASLVILCLHQFIHFSLRRVGVETSWILLFFSCALPYLAWRIFGRFTWVKIVFLGGRPSPAAGDPGKPAQPLGTPATATK